MTLSIVSEGYYDDDRSSGAGRGTTFPISMRSGLGGSIGYTPVNGDLMVATLFLSTDDATVTLANGWTQAELLSSDNSGTHNDITTSVAYRVASGESSTVSPWSSISAVAEADNLHLYVYIVHSTTAGTWKFEGGAVRWTGTGTSGPYTLSSGTYSTDSGSVSSRESFTSGWAADGDDDGSFTAKKCDNSATGVVSLSDNQNSSFSCSFSVWYRPDSDVPASTTATCTHNEQFTQSGGATWSRIPLTLKSLAGAQPTASGALTRLAVIVRSVAGAEPTASATISRRLVALRSCNGTTTTMLGALSRKLAALRATAGAQPTATGSDARSRNRLYALAGAQPTATASLARLAVIVAGLLSGALATMRGALTYLANYHRSIAGAEPAPSGVLSRTAGAFARAIAGAQPSMTGYMHPTGGLVSSSLNGAQPAASGFLSRGLYRIRTSASTEPAASGSLHWRKAHHTTRAHALNATPLTRSA